MKIYPKTSDDLQGLESLYPYVLESNGIEIQMLSWDKIEYIKEVIQNLLQRIPSIQEVTIHPPLLEDYNFEVLSFANYNREVERLLILIAISNKYNIKINLLYHTCWNFNCWKSSGALARMKNLIVLLNNSNVRILVENIYSMVDKRNSAVLNIAKELDHNNFKVCIDICHLHCQANIFKYNFNEFLENYLNIDLCKKYVHQIHFSATLNNDGYIHELTHGRKHISLVDLTEDFNILKKYGMEDKIIVTEISENNYSSRIDQVSEIKMLKKCNLIK